MRSSTGSGHDGSIVRRDRDRDRDRDAYNPAAMSGNAASTDVAAMFDYIHAEIETQIDKLARLQQTVDALLQSPELFDTRDVDVMSAILQRQTNQVEQLQQGLELHKELYDGAVRDIEARILLKTQLLHDVDAKFGGISDNPILCAYFAKEQAALMSKLDAVKHKLMQTACTRLGPLLYGGNPHGAAAGATAVVKYT
jgi:hypothetical protein